MKKVIIRKDMLRKAVMKAVPEAVEGVDFRIGKKCVIVLPPEVKEYDDEGDLIAPVMNKVEKAVEDYAKLKGVGIKRLHPGYGGVEMTLDPEWEPPMGDWNDPSSRYHY